MRLLLIFSVLVLGACSSAYYSTMEKFGIHKRDLFVERVEDARNAQEDGQQEFKDALTQFKSVVSVKETGLEKYYKKLDAAYSDSTAAADEIKSRIDDVENVAEALFEEWEREISEYKNKALKQDSQSKLKATKQRYSKLIATMKKSENKLQPVLDVMNDQVLYLKHNLNAQAIDALNTESANINRDIQELLLAMQESIDEANHFIATMKQQAS